MISFYRKNIFAFIQILEKHGSLFTDQNKTGLDGILSDFKGDAEQISKKISAWYKTRSEIHNIQFRI